MLRRAQKSSPAPDAEKLTWLRLARTENVGTVTFYRLLELYGSAERALAAIPALAARGGRKKPLVVPPADTVEREYNALRQLGGDVVLASGMEYSLPLAATEDAPPVLSVLGRIELLQQPAIGIVGARNASLNGRKLATQLAQELGAAEQIVVSGLARGIDTAAHEGSLATGTIAVIAGGIDIVYPPENKKLYDQIAEQGLIVAESSLGQQPFAQSFPRRNRIISGLSAGVVVVEATLRSGSLITARLAGEQGRDVYAVPGHPFDPRAEGPNALLRDGAVLVRDARDVLEQLHSFTAGRPAPSVPRQFSDTEADPYDAAAEDDVALVRTTLLDQLSHAPTSIDELIRAAGVPAGALLTALMELELAGHARRLPGNRAMRVE